MPQSGPAAMHRSDRGRLELRLAAGPVCLSGRMHLARVLRKTLLSAPGLMPQLALAATHQSGLGRREQQLVMEAGLRLGRVPLEDLVPDWEQVLGQPHLSVLGLMHRWALEATHLLALEPLAGPG